MIDDYMEKLAAIATEMDIVQPQSNAKCDYDVLADAITWSDEYPSSLTGRASAFDCMKLVLRYRTTVILGAPEESLKVFWDHAKQLFPNWAGFEPSRSSPTDELIEFYQKQSKRELKRLNKLLGGVIDENSE